MAKKPEKRESYNPLLKSYPDSEKINGVSEGAEVLYVRLIAQSDDKGRYWGDPAMVLAKLFTHRMAAGEVTKSDVAKRLEELRTVGLIDFYEVAGKRYLQMVSVVKRLRPDVALHLICPEPVASVVTSSNRERNDDGPPTQPNHTIPNQILAASQRRQTKASSSKRTKAVEPDGFAEFWDTYPARHGRKTGRTETAKEFANLSPDDVALCLEAVRNYARETKATDRFPKDPVRFLRKDFWRDWLGTSTVADSQVLDPDSPEGQTWSFHG